MCHLNDVTLHDIFVEISNMLLNLLENCTLEIYFYVPMIFNILPRGAKR